MNTPTPRTDAVITKSLREDNQPITEDLIIHSRQLERKLIAANAKIAELKGLFEKYARFNHLIGCHKKSADCCDCTCGLDAALKKVRSL